MFFAGLPLATLLSIGAAAGALTVVFYILKLRRRPVAVPFSRIWETILRDKEATTLFSHLKRLLSLLLQLCLLAALVLALGDPRLSVAKSDGRNMVVLIDASASMKATDVSPSRIEAAKREVERMIRGLGGSDRMLIAQLSAALTPLSTMTSDITELEKALEAVRATDTRANLALGIEFSRDSLRGLDNAEIVLVSDGSLGTEALDDLERIRLSFIPVGEHDDNVALTGFSVRRYPLDKSRYEVMLEVTNTVDRPATVELTLLGDGDVVDVTRLALRPNERLPRFYRDLSGAGHSLVAALKPLGTHDYLPADDRAYALMPERRRARVLVVTPGNTYLEAALLLDEYLDVALIDPKDYPPRERFDVTIFDTVAPERADHTGAALYLAPPEQGAPVARAKPIEDFGFDTWEKNSALLRWMAMEDIQAARGFALKPEKSDKIVGASELGPILVSGSRHGLPFVVLGFDPRDSDFVMRVAWPLFVLNTINYFVEEDTRYISSYRTGEVWRIPAPSGARAAALEEPGGKLRDIPIQDGRAVYLGEQAGFYKLKAQAGGEAVASAFAANLSSLEESQIKPVKKLEIRGAAAAAPAGFRVGVRRELWIYLLLAVIGVSLIEWVTFHRRVTV
jgi:hypothetical protein